MLKIRFDKKIAFSDSFNLRFSACPGLVFWQARVVKRRFHIFSNHKKGVVLLIVLGTLLVVVSLTTVILSLILSHSRLTYHQTSRIQAYYAAMAGVNYALEKLRTGDANWIPSPDTSPNTRTRTLCKSGCDVNEVDLPSSIQRVAIVIEAAGTGIGGTRRLKTTATYTYTP